uniref:Uncharacterized protein LOC111111559 n=1 Tax=Crassostrea virginica TaxID=6565 RepID=A0A8B8BN27_CRAVI|nr:uncharacterized protein LOC111111559 [Crassostrea virginica]
MLASDILIREKILKLYDDVIGTLRNLNPLPADLRDTLQEDELLERTREKRKAFSEDHCQVVVSGEISAGKSSLLNLLIGTEILPTSLLESRSLPCRLQYSAEKRAKLIDSTGSVIDDINYDEDEETKKRLKRIIEGTELVPNLAYVDIFLNESSLKGNVMLVDTPGIKEEDTDDNEQLFNHLRKASAFLYIIKTDSAGGTHKLFKIQERVKQLTLDGGMQLNPDSMLYVCNKWDQVDESEDQRVFEEIRSRIRQNGIEVKEGQLLKLSVRKERKRRLKRKPHTDLYLVFKDKLQQLMGRAIKNRYQKECIWLHKALRSLISIVNLYQSSLQESLQERTTLQREFQEDATSLKKAADTPKMKYCRKVMRMYTILSLKLHDHLRTKETCSDIIRKCKSEMTQRLSDPNIVSLKDIENASNETLQKLINEEITKWRENNQVDNACAQIEKEVLGSYRRLEQSLEQRLMNSGRKCSLGSAQVPTNADSNVQTGSNEDNQLFTKSEKVALVLTLTVGLPIAVTASVFLVPVGVAKILSEKHTNWKTMTDFRKNIDQRLSELLQGLYDSEAFTKDRFYEGFEKNHIRLFNQWIVDQYEKFVIDIDRISATLEQLTKKIDIDVGNNSAVELFLKQVVQFQADCLSINSEVQEV